MSSTRRLISVIRGRVKRLSRASAFAVLSASAAARAEAPKSAQSAGPSLALPNQAYSEYERQTMRRALKRYRLEVDLQPEGKRIEDIAIDVIDVIEDRDPLPSFLNALHCTSRQRAIRRELLFATGARWETDLVQETERNIRALDQESLVIILPIKGTAPDKVRVLVIAKDVWSLRLNTGYTITGRGLEYLLVQPSEENLMGMHRTILTNFVYDPQAVALGAQFIEPRLADSRIQATASANAIVNHHTGAAEGSYGTFSYGVPLYSTRQKWAWGATASWQHAITRHFVGTDIALFNGDTGESVLGCAAPNKCIPFVYNSDVQSGQISGTRSFGIEFKQDVTFGAAADRRAYTTGDLSAYDRSAVAAFVAKRVPLSDTRNGPFFLYHFYLNRYMQIVDVETLGLQESYRLGPEAYARVYPISRTIGSRHNLLGQFAAASYTQKLPDGFARLYGAGDVEVGLGAERDFAAGQIVNSFVQTGLRVVSPRFFIGRLVYDASLLYRPTNEQHAFEMLGGSGRLRGYLSNILVGQDLLVSNLEFRSRSVQLWTFQLGGALFYDVGDAFDTLATLRPKQGAGFGLRMGFPQLERSVLRVDWGFRLTPGVPHQNLADGLIITFDQAFGVPALTSTGVSN